MSGRRVWVVRSGSEESELEGEDVGLGEKGSFALRGFVFDESN